MCLVSIFRNSCDFRSLQCCLPTVRVYLFFFFFSSRRRHTRFDCDWSSDVCSSDLHTLRARTSKRREPPNGADLPTGPTSKGRQRPNSALQTAQLLAAPTSIAGRSEERRVGKECRSRWSPYH